MDTNRTALDCFRRLPLGLQRDLAEMTATVASAYQAGVFEALLDGGLRAEEVARRLDLDERAVSVLLPVLEELGLLERNGEVYELREESRRRLADPDSPEFAGGGLPLWLNNLRAFTRLPDVIRTGGPLEEDEDEDEEEERSEEALARFMAGMAAAPRERVERIVDRCLERRPGAERVLDLGGGPGHMSRAFIDRGLRATLLDTPETVRFVGREYGLNELERLTLVGADFLKDPLPPGPFDIVLMSNIVHIYGPGTNGSLLEKVAGVTAPGGVAGVADFVRGHSRRAARFALVMLLRTEEGNTYGEDEIASWLRAAGFADPVLSDVDEDRQIVTAIRAGGP